MDDNFKKIIADKQKRREEKEKSYNESSRERLEKIACKKVQTTMIGALETLETHFGFLWDKGDNGELSPEAIHMRQVFDEAREEILNKGNTQIRNLKNEMENYEVKWLRYTTEFKIGPTARGIINESEDGSEG